MRYSGWPEPGQLVVGKIASLEDFGVFVDLEEYEGKEGLIHISEVASGWIKNIRDHVTPGQTVVCKVLDVDPDSQQIDLSLKDVNEHQHKEAIQRWKNEQKADNWLSVAFGEDLDDEEYRRLASELIEAHGGLYEGFEQTAIHGEAALEDTNLAADEITAIVETARENVSVPYVSVTGYVDLDCPSPQGIDVIRDALREAEGDGGIPDDVELSVTYVGAPEYRIQINAPNYKTAEEHLEASAERAIVHVQEHGGGGEFHRERRTEEA